MLLVNVDSCADSLYISITDTVLYNYTQQMITTTKVVPHIKVYPRCKIGKKPIFEDTLIYFDMPPIYTIKYNSLSSHYVHVRNSHKKLKNGT